MPKTGFKSVTLNETIYSAVFEQYTKHIDHLKKRGISSFSAYVTYLLLRRDESLDIEPFVHVS